MWNSSYRTGGSLVTGNYPGHASVDVSSGCLRLDDIAQVFHAAATDFDVTFGYENTNYASFLIRATDTHTYVLQQQWRALEFYSTDTSLMPSASYGVGPFNGAGGYYYGGWCDAGSGLVHCSANGHVAWADFRNQTENPDGENKAWTWCHHDYNQNSSTQAVAEADPATPNRCKVAPDGASGTGIYARIQAVGTTLRAKIWQMGIQSEPAFWNMEVTDALPDSGYAPRLNLRRALCRISAARAALCFAGTLASRTSRCAGTTTGRRSA